MKVISTDELRYRLKQGSTPVFDVRGDVDYEMGHIPGAKTAPLGSLVFRVASVMDPKSFIIVYSSSGDGMAQEAAERLKGLNHPNVHCYVEGIEGWKSAGHPIVQSPAAKKIAQGPVIECRPIIVNTETAYGGAFKTTKQDDIGGAGG